MFEDCKPKSSDSFVKYTRKFKSDSGQFSKFVEPCLKIRKEVNNNERKKTSGKERNAFHWTTNGGKTQNIILRNRYIVRFENSIFFINKYPWEPSVVIRVSGKINFVTNQLGELTMAVDIDHKPPKKIEAIWSKTHTWPSN